MKKIGIACDQYKVKKFLAALSEAGFADVKESGKIFKSPTSPVLITIENVPADRVHDIHKICMKLEMDFRRSN